MTNTMPDNWEEILENSSFDYHGSEIKVEDFSLHNDRQLKIAFEKIADMNRKVSEQDIAGIVSTLDYNQDNNVDIPWVRDAITQISEKIGVLEPSLKTDNVDNQDKISTENKSCGKNC